MTAGECALCGLPTPDPPVTGDGVEGAFCCRGCLEVARSLDDVAAADGQAAREALDTGADAAEADGAAAYLSVSGMHCATCEAFLESRAAAHPGVRAAEASYPTNTVKVIYDADAVSEGDLPGVLDGTGYRARERGEAAEDDDEETVGRLLVGGFFGMMTMLWYVLFLYPAYLGAPPSWRLLDLHGAAGGYLLGNVWVMTSVVLGYTGYPILRGAYVSLRAGEPNVDLLVAVAASTAYVYSTAAMLFGRSEVYFDISVVVVMAVSLGDYYKGRIKRRATDRLSDLTASRVDEATRRTDAGTETVPVDAVRAGDELVVPTGDRVPVDGTVLEGRGAADESLVTGEARAVEKTPGDEVVGGSVLTDGRLVVRVSEGAESTLDRLVDVLWDVQSSRGGVQALADRIAGVFVPLVLLLAAGTFVVHLALGSAPTAAFLTGLAVLVVSCPCALGLATPLAVAAGVRAALERGVVVTDESVFERASDADVVAFDKTGTLTTGEMAVREVVGHERTLRYAAAVEQYADHPLGEAVVDAAGPPDAAVEDFERHPGRGVSATVDGTAVLVGRRALFDEADVQVPTRLADAYDAARTDGDTPTLVGWDGRARGVVVAGDEPRPGWEAVVGALDAAGKRVVVLTGDSAAAAARFREHPGVADVFAGVPPEAKAEVIDRLRAEGTVAMVGDGSNDAPALATADVGVAMASGTELAADAAELVVTEGDLRAVPRAFALTAAARTRIQQNLAWAFLYNVVAVPVAALGLLNPAVAAVAMAASSLLVVANSVRGLADGRTSAPAPAPDPGPAATADD
ncbi:MAG: heavy metal translocating P-type ATPase [Halobacteriaceae archaeon]